MGKETAATKETAAKLQPTESESQPAARGRWNNIIPALTWLRTYQPQWLRADLIAGITLAAYLMPAGLADASLANVPPEAGLYACLFSGLVFWLFCSSRHTAVTVTSAISVLVGASLGDLAGGDASRFWALASCTALIVGGLGFIAWLAKAGVIVNFVSESVLVGFKCGIALFIASTQLPKLFGFKGSHGDFWERSGYFFSHLRETNMASLLLGLCALAVLLLGKRFLKNKPVALFVVIAGMSQSLVNESGGARTPLSGFIAALLMLLIVLFVSGALRYLPQPVLAAIVLMAVTGLFKVTALKHFWRADREEFVVAIAALLGVLSSGLLRGVLIGAIISLVQLLRRASRPHVAFLGRIPGTRRFSDRARHPDNELIHGVLIFRPESGLVYFNVDNVCDSILSRVRAEPTPPKIVILDLSASPHMDIQACDVVMNMADDIKGAGARLQIVEARSSVRDRLRAEGMEEHVSQVNRFTSVADAVEDFQKGSNPTT